MKKTLKNAIAKANEKLGKASERYFAMPYWAQKGIYIGIGIGIGALVANWERIYNALTGATYMPGLDVNGDGIRDYSFWSDSNKGVFVLEHDRTGYLNHETPGTKLMHLTHGQVDVLGSATVDASGVKEASFDLNRDGVLDYTCGIKEDVVGVRNKGAIEVSNLWNGKIVRVATDGAVDILRDTNAYPGSSGLRVTESGIPHVLPSSFTAVADLNGDGIWDKMAEFHPNLHGCAFSENVNR